MAKTKPRVSVLTAVHNGERYLEATIASIVAQSFGDFEYILVDDASSDTSPAILAAWAQRDSRICLLHNAQPLNPAGALNRALAQARGDYVAILDHDDIAYPERLAEEVAFLDANPQVAVVGSQAVRLNAEGDKQKSLHYPTSAALARWQFFFLCPVLHSAAMMRRSLVEQVGGYSVRIWTATDYDLFARLAQVGDLTNLPTVLAGYRQSEQQVSNVHSRTQLGHVVLFLNAFLVQQFGVRLGLPTVTSLYLALRTHKLSDAETLREAAQLLGNLLDAFLTRHPVQGEARELIYQDCAGRYLQLAWGHRRLFRLASREVLASGLALDPLLLKRPQNRAMLRRMGKQR